MVYFSLIITSLIMALLITPGIIVFCKKHKVLSDPQRYKFYRDSKPLLGGISIFIAAFLPALMTIFFTSLTLNDLVYNKNEIFKITLSFLFASFLVLISGIWADLKYIKGKYHWLFIFVASIIIHFSGFKFAKLSNPFGEPIEVGSWGILLTIFWIIIITNIIEILNFIEGFSTIIVLVFSSVLLYGAAEHKEIFVTILISTFTGSLIGYLFYNMYPSKIIYGKSGVRFLGFMIASIILFARRKVTTTAIFIFPSAIIIFFLVLIILSSLEKTLILKNKDIISTKGKN